MSDLGCTVVVLNSLAQYNQIEERLSHRGSPPTQHVGRGAVLAIQRKRRIGALRDS